LLDSLLQETVHRDIRSQLLRFAAAAGRFVKQET